MKTELLRVCDALLTAGLNGVLEGLVLLLLVVLGLRWFGQRMNATTRHAAYLVTLSFLVALIPANGLRHFLASRKPDTGDLQERADSPRNPSLRAANENSRKTEVAPTDGKAAPLNFVFLPLPREQQREATSDLAKFEELVRVEDPTNFVFQAPGPLALEQNGRVRRTQLLLRSDMDSATAGQNDSLFETGPGPAPADSAAIQTTAVTDQKVQSPAPESTVSAAEAEPVPPLAQAILDAARVIEATAGQPEPSVWDNAKAAMIRFSGILLEPVSLNLADRSWFPGPLSLALVAACALFAACRLTVIVARLRRIGRLKETALEPTPELRELFLKLCGQMQAKRRVTLGLATAHRSAVLLGFCHPKILLPAECDVREAEPVLRHELAHLNRRDDWTNLCQQLIQAAFFFHPGVWWVCRQLTLEREIACDDCVLEKSTPRSYALLLATLAGRMQGSPALLAPGVSTNKSQLKQRIDMILDTHRNTSLRVGKTRLGLIASAAACMALAAIYTAPRIVVAQTAPAAPGAPAAPPALARTAAADTVAIAPGAAVPAGEAIAVDEPGTPAPAAGNSTGPRYKTLAPVPVPATSAAAPADFPSGGVIALTPAPAAPAAPMVLVAPPTPGTAPIAVVGQGGVVAAYEPASPPRHKDTSDMSIEQRLDRLERMIESLNTKREYKLWQPNPNFKWETQPKMNGSWDQKQSGQFNDFIRQQADMARKQAEMARDQLEAARQHGMDSRELDRLKADIERETSRAGEEMKRAARELERAMREQQSHNRKPEAADVAPRKRAANKDASRQQLEGLRRQHEALERQMEKLDRQIEELEGNQEEVEQQDEDQGPEQAEVQSNDATTDQPKPECAEPKEAPKNLKPAEKK